MPRLRPLTHCALFGLLWGLTGAACGTKAEGVEECRRIELARCQAAEPCGLLRTAPFTDVPSCERFYRDQCLHGIQNGVLPGGPEVDACVATIQRAGECAVKSGKNSSIADCPGLGGDRGACAVVRAPELHTSCAFLPGYVAETAGAGGGGASGAGGSGGKSSAGQSNGGTAGSP